MSNKQELQEAVKALTEVEKEIKKAVNKAVQQVDTVRQVQTEQSSRQS